MSRGTSVILLWREIGVLGENLPVRPGNHKPSNVATSNPGRTGEGINY